MKIETGVVLREYHETTVDLVYLESGGDRGVHGDAANLADGSEGQDVSDRSWVIPDGPEVRDIADELGDLGAAVGVHGDMSIARANVQK